MLRTCLGRIVQDLFKFPNNTSLRDDRERHDADDGELHDDCCQSFQLSWLRQFVSVVVMQPCEQVHPHTSDQPDDFGDKGEDIVDLWYGTTEPLSRVRAGETLIFYDPVRYSLRHREAFLPRVSRKAVVARWTSRRWGGLRPSLPRCC